VVAYGRANAVPVTGDWDGIGTTTIGVAFARSDGQIGWQLRNANTAWPPDIALAYGGVRALAIVTGDWDGNGSDALGAVYGRSGELEWQLRDAITPGRPDHVFRYGGLEAGALVAGDWDGNRTWTPGVAY
jgi:outer membrane protein assembly factor BamB